VATLTRHRRPDDPELIGAAQELKTVKLEEFITKALAEAPSLTHEQLQRVFSAVGHGAR
jgi:hypothetical protein